MNLEQLIIPPIALSLLTTNKCTAACKDCCFACNPKNKDKLTLMEMKNYIDQSVKAYSTIKVLVLTGGECFTLGKDLDRIIKYGTDNGLIVRVVTNGYWAKSFKKAYLRLEKLAKLGLKEFNLSTGDAHQKFVSFDNIVYAIVAALKLNLTTVVNIETNDISDFKSKNIEEDIRLKKYMKTHLDKKLILLNGSWMPFTQSTEQQLELAKQQRKNNKLQIFTRCTSLFNTISVTPYNHINACCGLTSEYISYLQLGNAKKYSVKELYEYQFKDFLKIWLFIEGPKKILDFIYEIEPGRKVDTKNWHICQICAKLLKDEENIKIIQKNYKQVFSKIILDYSFKQKNIINSIKKLE
jgi:MoaA/NifB/PqqE/SkfB family radical SAM enzyme